MFKKALMLLFVFSCLLSSCRATRQEIQKTESKTTVTKETTVTQKDTTLFAPKAETSLKIPLRDIEIKKDLNGVSKPINYSQKNGQAKVKIKIVHDTIEVTATCDSLAIRAKIRKEFQRETLNEKNNIDNSISKKTGYTFLDLIWAFVVGFAVCYVLKMFRIL